MSCIKSLFKCNFSNNNEQKASNSWCDENLTFLRKRLIDIELDIKAMKLAHDLEIKRVEDKLTSSIQILTTKIDSVLLLVHSKQN